MQPREMIDFLRILSKLKINTRHVRTSQDREESVAEHSWRLAVMALLVADEFPGVDADKVVKMCLIHDFGEAITGDIPSFLKTKQDEEKEDSAVADMLLLLPEKIACEFRELFLEMTDQKTLEAKLFKALDKLEALLSHNESALDTWLPNEYSLNLTYGIENMQFSDYLKMLREEIRVDTEQKIKEGT